MVITRMSENAPVDFDTVSSGECQSEVENNVSQNSTMSAGSRECDSEVDKQIQEFALMRPIHSNLLSKRRNIGA
eukprot:16438152-Heterocapsa_arctica.AAC.1